MLESCWKLYWPHDFTTRVFNDSTLKHKTLIISLKNIKRKHSSFLTRLTRASCETHFFPVFSSTAKTVLKITLPLPLVDNLISEADQRFQRVQIRRCRVFPLVSTYMFNFFFLPNFLLLLKIKINFFIVKCQIKYFILFLFYPTITIKLNPFVWINNSSKIALRTRWDSLKAV